MKGWLLALLLSHFLIQREGISRELVFRVSRANRMHNSDLSVCHTLRTHTHTQLKHSLGRNKSHHQVEKVGQRFVPGLTDFTVCFGLLSCTTVTTPKPPWQEQRERGGDGNVREECWKDELIQAEACWHVCGSVLGAQFCVCVCVSISSRQRGLMKSALLVWHPLHTERATCAEKLKILLFIYVSALNKVLCRSTRTGSQIG